MPEIRPGLFEQRIRAIPKDAAPVYSWRGERTDLKTYWGDQEVSIHVSAYLPEDWNNPGDGYWQVTAQNGAGKLIPFIGVVRHYVNEKGTELAILVPSLDMQKTPDGLYLAIIPNVETGEGRVSSIRPIAMLCEIRNHSFKPFRVKIPLFPEKESELTPAPEPLPRMPPGTPIPVH